MHLCQNTLKCCSPTPLRPTSKWSSAWWSKRHWALVNRFLVGLSGVNFLMWEGNKEPNWLHSLCVIFQTVDRVSLSLVKNLGVWQRSLVARLITLKTSLQWDFNKEVLITSVNLVIPLYTLTVQIVWGALFITKTFKFKNAILDYAFS